MNEKAPEKGTLMVVDDDETIRSFVEWVLLDEGYEVVSAADGQGALDSLRSVQPDLILLDLRMPVMDGFAFARAYRDLPGPHAPVVVISAACDGHDPAPSIEAAGFLAKPFDIEDLLAVVEHHTASRR